MFLYSWKKRIVVVLKNSLFYNRETNKEILVQYLLLVLVGTLPTRFCLHPYSFVMPDLGENWAARPLHSSNPDGVRIVFQGPGRTTAQRRCAAAMCWCICGCRGSNAPRPQINRVRFQVHIGQRGLAFCFGRPTPYAIACRIWFMHSPAAHHMVERTRSHHRLRFASLHPARLRLADTLRTYRANSLLERNFVGGPALGIGCTD